MVVVVLGLSGVLSQPLHASEASQDNPSRQKVSTSPQNSRQEKDLSEKEFKELVNFVKKVSKDQPLESSLLKHLATYLADKILSKL